MKIKYFLIISLTLALITLGAVSSYEDLNCTDQLEVDENIPVEMSLDEVLQTEDDSQDDVSVYVYDYSNVDEEYSSVASVYDNNYLNGNVTVVIDDLYTYTNSFNEDMQEYFYDFTIRDFKNVPSYGLHKVNVTYHNLNTGKLYDAEKLVNFKYSFGLNVDGEDADEFWISCDAISKFAFYMPEGVNGVIRFNLNSRNYSCNVKEGIGYYNFNFKNVPIGKYILNAEFIDNNNVYPIIPLKVSINVDPKVYIPWDMAIGEKDAISVTALKNDAIDAVLYKNENNKTNSVFKISGKSNVNIPLDKLIVEGENNFTLNCTINGVFNKSYHITIYALENDKKFKSGFTKIGDSVKIYLTGPKNNYDLEVYMDNKFVKSLNLKKGKVSHTISNLAIGKHKINIKTNGGNYYSYTYFVTIKEIDKAVLKLKSVKIKKSAKKLVLSASLKINKKAKKGLKLVFKFNGKTYKAKTNKKGVAKVTIKKKVLLKLKKGKKIKYQVSFNRKVVKKTARVQN